MKLVGWKRFTDSVPFRIRKTGKNAKWDDYVHRVPIPAGATPTSVVMEGIASGGVGFCSGINTAAKVGILV